MDLDPPTGCVLLLHKSIKQTKGRQETQSQAKDFMNSKSASFVLL